ncbi:SurA N-terminal domain-containing protein [Streptacidiphilus fuscans]|uniref:SurA N-terminal domain-containing protein n=1 Tax=Streptacidiphilus fuscans TaxID=2789292 RepID=A0A931FD41_9ACTN|nr:SurA N-terminal domain-containing protein [Streptacidiphilus fuscans]MBF9067790.1 SurA N-terminal domain-containing protein [Streptacidiphilus fuscans]MBF9073873.1 SurA N-terminal domain-containing protein [Streptacidiphilus fuscans]
MNLVSNSVSTAGRVNRAAVPPRRRSRARAAFAVLLAGAAVTGLSACSGGSADGGTAHTGSAAVVGGTRISMATVQDQVNAFRAAAPAQGQPASAGQAQMFGQDSPGVPTAVLQFLIQSEVVQSALDAKGLSVTATEVSAAEAQNAASLGGAAQLTTAFVAGTGLPPSDLDGYFRMRVGEEKLVAASGVTQATQQQFDADAAKLLAAQAEKIGIDVNPRYGSWDAASGGLVAAPQPWLKTV